MSNTNPTTKRKWTKKHTSIKRKEAIQGYIFILPWLIGLIVFTLGPLLFSFIGSFTNYDITSQMDFVGLENYKRLFSRDPLFWKALGNTIYYVAISVPATLVAAVIIALLMNQKIPGIRFFRTIYYLPSVLSGVGVYFLWMQLLSPQSGLINVVLSWFGIEGPVWLFDPNWTKPALIFMNLWKVGGSMLLYLASLQGIPTQLYEAAEIDGAGHIRKFLNITLPMITPIIFFDLVTSIIGSFQVFQEAYVMSQNGSGGPANSMLFFNLHMWNKAFVNFEMGYAMAMSWILFLIVFVITLINLKLAPRWVYREGGN
ncbi:sugar ABC transporter permease [Aerococcaceae bacterium INB8]|uniref:Sugar ABC transporter permease n=1 Tax=Ruoffia halotolerans TaxID=2748684 RepID=A0A839A4R6_9LACT|nr:sugar ABC transporter permease [Ruoffia halotolerans]MBA5728911.1 sugar ABC transporter permease [Ruoffia halotolerans]